MLSCNDCQFRFSEALEGRLAPEKEPELLEHLEACPACAAAAESMSAAHRLLLERHARQMLGCREAPVRPSSRRTTRRLVVRQRAGRTALALGALAAAAAILLVAWLGPVDRKDHVTEAGPAIAALSGRADLLRGDGRQAASPGLQLAAGDRVETLAAARVTLRYANGTTVEMNEKTVAGSSVGGLALERGDIYVTAAGPITVNRGEYDEVSVLGTEFEVSRRAAATDLRVAGGRVRFGAAASAVGVDALRASRVAAGGTPGAPEAVGLAAIAPWRNDLNRGLVGWWKFDEGAGTEARDSSGAGNHGKVFGGASRVAGKSGGALQFVGEKQFVDVGNGPALRVTDQVTVAGWVKLLAPERKNFWCCIVGQEQPNRNYNFYYRHNRDKEPDWGHPQLRLSISNRLIETAPAWNSTQVVGAAGGSRSLLADGSRHVVTAAAYPPDQAAWHHVVGVIDTAAGGSHRYYVDGKLVVEYRNLGFDRLATNTASFRLGWSLGDLSRCLDDIRVYNRALAAEEVARLARQGQGEAPPGH